MPATRLTPAECACGCGEATPLARYTDNRRGHRKGKFLPYLKGHERRIQLADKFWKYVNKTQDCWLWTGAKINSGYGVTTVIRNNVLAHRASWMLTNGDPPEDLYVLHKCDVRLCVRPDHLFLGTAKDNTHDMIAKGRAKFRS